ncbi:hypothetical protein PVAP13_4NG304266 [Panicum virgatum]|uniref:Uncharacterized protein n=1 Tax=Panicum virgatum TaxID=38727 RepID=A0A8T0TAB6_PANVG|nr:hypothetical protein PVAP13_4NG304266 [Panicum virgatum]
MGRMDEVANVTHLFLGGGNVGPCPTRDMVGLGWIRTGPELAHQSSRRGAFRGGPRGDGAAERTRVPEPAPGPAGSLSQRLDCARHARCLPLKSIPPVSFHPPLAPPPTVPRSGKLPSQRERERERERDLERERQRLPSQREREKAASLTDRRPPGSLPAGVCLLRRAGYSVSGGSRSARRRGWDSPRAARRRLRPPPPSPLRFGI